MPDADRPRLLCRDHREGEGQPEGARGEAGEIHGSLQEKGGGINRSLSRAEAGATSRTEKNQGFDAAVLTLTSGAAYTNLPRPDIK